MEIIDVGLRVESVCVGLHEGIFIDFKVDNRVQTSRMQLR